MSDNMIRGMAVLCALLCYGIPLGVIGAIIEYRLERQEVLADKHSKEMKRRREQDIKCAGQNLMNADERNRIMHEPPIYDRRKHIRDKPIRKVCGVFSDSAEVQGLWEVSN